MDIVERLRFDAVICETTFSKGVVGNIEEAAAEIERLRAALTRIAAGGGDWEEARNVAINTLNDGTVPPPTAVD